MASDVWQSKNKENVMRYENTPDYPSMLTRPVTEDDIESLFKIFFRRSVNNDAWRQEQARQKIPLEKFITQLRQSEELKNRILNETSRNRIDDYRFRIPQHLNVSPTFVKKILLVGSCLLVPWKNNLEGALPDLVVDYVTFNNASPLPDLDADTAKSYDFQLLQLPLRSVLHESAFFQITPHDDDAHERLFANACLNLKRNFEALVRYNSEYNIESYIMGFYKPIQNPLGRAQPRYKFSNLSYFIERLNERLYELVQSTKNAYYLDFDEIISTYGKKSVQDDFTLQSNHGSFLSEISTKTDHARLEPAGSVRDLYLPNVPKIIRTVFEEAVSIHKANHQLDSVKLVIFDLDDTMWRGIAAELDDPDPSIVEGWPLGIIEAASALWRRGILLAIVSKNDETIIRTIWNKVIGKRLSLGNFVSIKINWTAKADNIAEILKEVNLLPSSVLFVDDNPLERAAVQARFPDIRVMDAQLVEWKRILMWAPELQRTTITEEATGRTETIKAQIVREESRKSVGHEEFLQNLGVTIQPNVVRSSDDPRFARCFELLNKTNQFNTTGRRWTATEVEGFFANGGFMLALSVSDNYTDYGMTGLLLVQDSTLLQFVLSCRVFGMGVENAAVALVCGMVQPPITGLIQPTDKNKLSQPLFKNLGFKEPAPGSWVAPFPAPTIPAHVMVTSTPS